MNELRPTNAAELERAEAVSPDPVNPKIRTMEVIDTDFHFSPKWETLRSYLKEPFKSRLFHFPLGSIEYNPEPANEKPGVGQDTHGTASTAADVLRVLDQFGIDTVVINPGYNRPQAIFNEPVIAAISSAHNDYLIEEVFPVSDRIKANLMICHRDPQMGAAEIRRVGHHRQFVGVFTSFSGLFEPIGNAKCDPILDAMQEHDLVLTAHSEGWFPHFTPLWTGARTWIELFGNAPAGNCMAHLAAMIVQGMFDKYPKQKVIFQEGGYWWLPDFMLRLDDFYMSAGGDIALTSASSPQASAGSTSCRANTFSITSGSRPSRSRSRRTASTSAGCSSSVTRRTCSAFPPTGRTRPWIRPIGSSKIPIASTRRCRRRLLSGNARAALCAAVTRMMC